MLNLNPRLYIYRGGPRDGTAAHLHSPPTASGVAELVALTRYGFHTYRSTGLVHDTGPGDAIVVHHCPELTRTRTTSVDC